MKRSEIPVHQWNKLVDCLVESAKRNGELISENSLLRSKIAMLRQQIKDMDAEPYI